MGSQWKGWRPQEEMGPSSEAGLGPLIVACLLIFIAFGVQEQEGSAERTPQLFVQRSTYWICYFRVHIPLASQSPDKDPGDTHTHPEALTENWEVSRIIVKL